MVLGFWQCWWRTYQATFQQTLKQNAADDAETKSIWRYRGERRRGRA